MHRGKEIDEFIERCLQVLRDMAEEYRPQQMKQLAEMLKVINIYFLSERWGEMRLKFRDGNIVIIEENYTHKID